MKSNFLMFAAPLFNSIDNGIFFKRPFIWFYTLIAVLNGFIPFYLIFELRNDGQFSDVGLIGGGLLILGSLFASWLSFQLWLHRRESLFKISSQGDEFVATPVFAHLFQTIGEWIGIWSFVTGVFYAFLFLFGGNKFYDFLGFEEVDFLIKIVIFFVLILSVPITSFFIVLLFRFLAEQFRVLAAIGNNTRLTKSKLE